MISVFIKNFIFTLSTFTQIRTIHVEFTPTNTKYTYHCLPFIGLIVGVCSYFSALVISYFINEVIIGSLLMFTVNIIITGGIHHDGLLDSLDAFKCYRDNEEKKRIIKDPRVGAFAIIYYTVILILFVCTNYYIISNDVNIIFFVTPIISRMLVLHLITNNQLEKDDMLDVLMDESLKKIITPLSIIIFGFTYVMFTRFLILIIWFFGGLYLMYFHKYFKKHFDCLNGDLCGYFIITCELICLLIAALSTLI